jgi:hypothetical protein
MGLSRLIWRNANNTQLVYYKAWDYEFLIAVLMKNHVFRDTMTITDVSEDVSAPSSGIRTPKKKCYKSTHRHITENFSVFILIYFVNICL